MGGGGDALGGLSSVLGVWHMKSNLVIGFASIDGVQDLLLAASQVDIGKLLALWRDAGSYHN